MMQSQPLMSQDEGVQARHDAHVEAHYVEQLMGLGKLILGIILLAIVGVIAFAHVRYNPTLQYAELLDSVAVVALGVAFAAALWLNSACFLLTRPWTPQSTDEVVKKGLTVTARMNVYGVPTSIQEVFGESAWTLTRMFNFASLVCFLAINMGSFALAVYRALLQRNPEKKLDFLQHFVPAFEFATSINNALVLLIVMVRLIFVHPAIAKKSAETCTQFLHLGANFSAASGLGQGYGFLPVVVNMNVPYRVRVNICLQAFMMLAIGMCGLVTKVAALHFLSTRWIYEWDFSQWLTLAAYANNTLKMGRSDDQMTLSEGQLDFQALVQMSAEKGSEYETLTQYSDTLWREVGSTYGKFHSVVILGTMTKEEAHKLFLFCCFCNPDECCESAQE